MPYEDLLSFSPFELEPAQKAKALKKACVESFDHHYAACEEYRRFCDKRGVSILADSFDYADIPYLPVGIFKKLALSSVGDADIVRTLHSSATSSQTPSTVVLDNITRTRQVRTLLWLLAGRLGKQRRPFVVLDVDPAKSVGASAITARSAAIRGFLAAASSFSYCMKDDDKGGMELDVDTLAGQMETARDSGERVVLFGFTYIVYSYVARVLADRGISLPETDGTLLHIGGWKKLQGQAVSRDVFNTDVSGVLGLPREEIVDIYGFTEQLGIVYADDRDGLKRCPGVSEVLVRDPTTLQPVPDGEPGLLEFITPLPHSYPGLALLLDDMGRVVTREPGSDGQNGTAFEVIGRATHAELRGCGDILAENLETSA